MIILAIFILNFLMKFYRDGSFTIEINSYKFFDKIFHLTLKINPIKRIWMENILEMTQVGVARMQWLDIKLVKNKRNIYDSCILGRILTVVKIFDNQHLYLCAGARKLDQIAEGKI